MTRLFLIMPAFKFTVISLSRYGWMFTYLSLLQEINNVVAARIVFLPASSSQASKRLRQPPVRSLMVKFHFDQVVRVARTVPTSKKMDLFF